MASDVMRVRLHLREIRVLAVVVDTPSELRVRVESTVRRPRCPHCGFKCHRVHDTRERSVRDLEVSGRRTTLVWMRRRLVCGNCDSRWLEEHPEFDGTADAAPGAASGRGRAGDDDPCGGAPPRCELAVGERAGEGLVGARRRAPPQPAVPGAAWSMRPPCANATAM